MCKPALLQQTRHFELLTFGLDHADNSLFKQSQSLGRWTDRFITDYRLQIFAVKNLAV